MALLLFAEKFGWHHLNDEEKHRARIAQNTPNVPYMDHYLYSNVYSTPATLQSYRIRSREGSRIK